MTYLRCSLFLLAVTLGIVGCGSSTQTSESDSSADMIVVSELPASVQHLSAYDVVNQYRSNWLRQRGPKSINNPNPVQVYLGRSGSPYGGVESLRNIPASNVEVIKYYDSQAAQFRFGMSNVSGAILVERKGGG